LRYLQTLSGIATEQNSTIVFPVPIDILSLFQNSELAFKPSLTTASSNTVDQLTVKEMLMPTTLLTTTNM
ncbi:unnamed protein product, partial [Rotaria magnacalcarata]